MARGGVVTSITSTPGARGRAEPAPCGVRTSPAVGEPKVHAHSQIPNSATGAGTRDMADNGAFVFLGAILI